jgi:hypothetical protein
MADVTGRIYEAFTEFILRRLGYRDEWTEGDGKQYLYEKHRPALCHTSTGICAHAKECHDFSTKNGIEYGPWYDPDFFILEQDKPTACLHVTHWSSPGDSHRKFLRSIEDHFQYKNVFGHSFLSVNLIFVALDATQTPQLIQDSNSIIEISGWKPAVGAVMATNFDASILFPKSYSPLEKFVTALPAKIPSPPRLRRQTLNNTWENLYSTDQEVRTAIDQVVDLFQQGLSVSPHPRLGPIAVAHLQSVCFRGRQNTAKLQTTCSRYRKGIQLSFILRELISRHFGKNVNPDDALWNILTSSPRFGWNDFGELLGTASHVSDNHINAFREALAAVPVKTDKQQAIFLLNNMAGLEHADWESDFKQFILGLRTLSSDDIKSFRIALNELFANYRSAYGMTDTLSDLADPARVTRKVEYVGQNYIGIADRDEFIDKLSSDLLRPGDTPTHQKLVSDQHNWVADILLGFYDLGSMQHITTNLPSHFEISHGHSLRPYAFRNNYAALVSNLLSGVPVGQYFSNGAKFSEPQFYNAIWPLFATCLWEAIQGVLPLDPATVAVNYRYKKAMRIIASPDLEPIKFLFRRSLPMLTDGPTLRGCFNQLSRQRGWGTSALTTETSGLDPKSGVIIQTQAVIGAKNIDHKVKELAARIRSVHLRCNADGVFEPQPNPGTHYLVVDGDWPIESKINLYEAGFSGIFEIAQLDKLAAELARKEGDLS